MAATFWKGAIDFGLVHIPVALVNAEQPRVFSFHLVDEKDHAPIRYKRINEETGKEVEWKNIVKGYESADGKFITFTEEELKEIAAEANKSIEIEAFVDKKAIAPVYYAAPYVVVPQKGGEKGYALIQKALEKSGKVALVQVVIRTKQHLAVLFPMDDALILNLLRYENELKKPSEVLPAGATAVKISDKESKMAERLIEEMVGTFKPERYKDHYAEKLRAAVKQKVSGAKRTKKKASAKEEALPVNVVDIVDLLSKSLKNKKPSKQRKRA